MQNDLDWAKRAKCVSSKIYMASEYFYNLLFRRNFKTKNKINYSITYHDPCHARKCKGF